MWIYTETVQSQPSLDVCLADVKLFDSLSFHPSHSLHMRASFPSFGLYFSAQCPLQCTQTRISADRKQDAKIDRRSQNAFCRFMFTAGVVSDSLWERNDWPGPCSLICQPHSSCQPPSKQLRTGANIHGPTPNCWHSEQNVENSPQPLGSVSLYITMLCIITITITIRRSRFGGGNV